MRPIKFKAKMVHNELWVEGSFISPDTIRDENDMDWYIIPSTLCQFTVLHDKDGKDIWEGDYDQNYDVVTWCNRRMGWAMSIYDHPTNDIINCYCYNCEGNFEISEIIKDFAVPGNIHDKK